MEKEEWKVVDFIHGYENVYKISNYGRLFSLKRNIIKTPSVDKDGYLRHNLYKNSQHKAVHAHRLVLLAFGESVVGKPVVDHIDGDRKNNHISNLRWCTVKENNQWGKNSYSVMIKSLASGRVKTFNSLSSAGAYYGFNINYFTNLTSKGIFKNKHFEIKLLNKRVE